MVHITSAKIDLLREDEYNAILSQVDEVTHQRAIACYNQQKAKSIILADYLVKDQVSNIFQILYEQVKIQKSVQQTGKPEVLGVDGCYISYSHSGQHVLVAVADHPIGCDVQVFKRTKIIPNTFFTKSDEGYIVNSMKYGEALAEIWSAKESYFKYTGTGWVNIDINFSRPQELSDAGVWIYKKVLCSSAYLAVCVGKEDTPQWHMWKGINDGV